MTRLKILTVQTLSGFVERENENAQCQKTPECAATSNWIFSYITEQNQFSDSASVCTFWALRLRLTDDDRKREESHGRGFHDWNSMTRNHSIDWVARQRRIWSRTLIALRAAKLSAYMYVTGQPVAYILYHVTSAVSSFTANSRHHAHAWHDKTVWSVSHPFRAFGGFSGLGRVGSLSCRGVTQPSGASVTFLCQGLSPLI